MDLHVTAALLPRRKFSVKLHRVQGGTSRGDFFYIILMAFYITRKNGAVIILAAPFSLSKKRIDEKSCTNQKVKVSLKPFQRLAGVKGAAPLVAVRRRRNPLYPSKTEPGVRNATAFRGEAYCEASFARPPPLL